MGFDLFWSDDQMVQESCNLDKDEAEILKPSSPSSASPSPPPTSNPPPLFLKRSADVAAIVAPSGEPDPVEQSQRPMRLINRCCSCRRRVGLAGGFRCRCGELFCSRHRYSDTHDCSFDYKAAGREEISKANPLIRAAKIIKI